MKKDNLMKTILTSTVLMALAAATCGIARADMTTAESLNAARDTHGFVALPLGREAEKDLNVARQASASADDVRSMIRHNEPVATTGGARQTSAEGSPWALESLTVPAPRREVCQSLSQIVTEFPRDLPLNGLWIRPVAPVKHLWRRPVAKTAVAAPAADSEFHRRLLQLKPVIISFPAALSVCILLVHTLLRNWPSTMRLAPAGAPTASVAQPRRSRRSAAPSMLVNLVRSEDAPNARTASEVSLVTFACRSPKQDRQRRAA